MSEICYACIGSCRHRYMNMKSESLSSGRQTRASYLAGGSRAPGSASSQPSPRLGHRELCTKCPVFARVLPRGLCSKVSFTAVLYHHILLLRFASGRPMGFLKTKHFFSRVRADPPGLVVGGQSVSEKEQRCQRCSSSPQGPETWKGEERVQKHIQSFQLQEGHGPTQTHTKLDKGDKQRIFVDLF